MSEHATLRRLPSDELTEAERIDLRAMLDEAFLGDDTGGFDDDDWQHALGGTHFVLDVDGQVVAHAAVVERQLYVAGQPLRTGYIEAVATRPGRERQGHGSVVMREVSAFVSENFEFGALGTGSHGFYERLGWQTWRGPSFVRVGGGIDRTPEDDGYIMVLLTPTSPPLDLSAPISCEWRPGDVW
ncbi:MAG TPA: GNAT family N-acetyltransferase [Candidatus Limnocylindrales bacterium]|nr:GNAT family N-acetyltransferase [Candidatus Limnocylindrales bacterium]